MRLAACVDHAAHHAAGNRSASVTEMLLQAACCTTKQGTYDAE